jgi:hypothetical protein
LNKHYGLKKLLLLIFPVLFFFGGFCQPNSYWQQQVDQAIRVTLNDADKTLDGFVQMNYRNNSPDTLRYIWIHCWPNAYKNDRTAFSDQLLENGRTDFYFSEEEQRGYINRLDFKVNAELAETEDHPRHQDIIKLLLPQPLAPGSTALIETPFHVKLPQNFSRSGYVKGAYQLTQWYPKPAVYDKTGWHEMPYLDQGEFYSEFGNYDVTITVPDEFIVAATGILQKETNQNGAHTLYYRQQNVHDFAWFADKDFIVKKDTVQLTSKTVSIAAYYHEKSSKVWENSMDYIKNAVRTKSEWLGEYPYDVVSVVEKDMPGADGMEYPTITLLSSPPTEKILDYLINHEVGHNWFYGILASNERQHPWMDEGMNTYYDNRYTLRQYGTAGFDVSDRSNAFTAKRLPDDLSGVLLQTAVATKKDQPIETPAEQFSEVNYGNIAYTKTGEWMKLLEQKMGHAAFDSMMHLYYARWKFRHPAPADFRAVAEEVHGAPLNEVFALLQQKGRLQQPPKKAVRFNTFFNLRDAERNNYISAAPAIGMNYYDGLMLGAIVHNYSLPPSRFRFFAAPLYATGSKQLNGIGRAGYSFYPGSKGNKIELFTAYARFSGDMFKPVYSLYAPVPYQMDHIDSAGKKKFQPFTKIVPGLRFSFAGRDPRSTVKKYIQWKTFLISETNLRFARDTTNDIDVITYPVEKRYLNQLQFVVQNDRVLYPYQGTLQVEQGDAFVRAAFTGNYFFNYKAGGGMNLRFFAGKFFYTRPYSTARRFETERYHLNMTGPNGYEDYTYSNYFIGRNEFMGYRSQQLMIRDGGLKIRTDLLSGKIARTDDWLSAINFTTSIPKQVDPFQLLPFKLPIRIFADIGTYAEAWNKDANTAKFLYDAGLQLSLFHNTVNVYMPLFYSNIYSNYLKSYVGKNYFVKNISFSIDLQQANVQKLIPQIPF